MFDIDIDLTRDTKKFESDDARFFKVESKNEYNNEFEIAMTKMKTNWRFIESMIEKWRRKRFVLKTINSNDELSLEFDDRNLKLIKLLR